MATVTKVEWWYDAALMYSNFSRKSPVENLRLMLAYCRVFDDGTAEILFSESSNSFASEEEAYDFLMEDEYLRLEDLKEEYGITVGVPVIR